MKKKKEETNKEVQTHEHTQICMHIPNQSISMDMFDSENTSKRMIST